MIINICKVYLLIMLCLGFSVMQLGNITANQIIGGNQDTATINYVSTDSTANEQVDTKKNSEGPMRKIVTVIVVAVIVVTVGLVFLSSIKF